MSKWLTWKRNKCSSLRSSSCGNNMQEKECKDQPLWQNLADKHTTAKLPCQLLPYGMPPISEWGPPTRYYCSPN
ncbi:unnamed protein product [Rhodiola kirilowii]